MSNDACNLLASPCPLLSAHDGNNDTDKKQRCSSTEGEEQWSSVRSSAMSHMSSRQEQATIASGA